MIKMIVSDFDYTLINYRDRFSKYQLEVLKRLRSKEFIFAVITGRGLKFFDLFPELLEVIDYLIPSNGGVIYDVVNKRFLYSTLINQDSLNKLIDYSISTNSTFIINELNKMYKYGDLKEIDSLEFEVNREYKSEQLIMYVLEKDKEQAMKMISGIDDLVINNTNCSNGVCSIDINDKSVSKGNALLWLCDYLNISTDEVLAFGDGENDVAMFKVVGKKIAVGNACDNLKKLADDITLSYSEYGVFKYIEENFLK